MTEKIRKRIIHEARNLWGGDITKEILSKQKKPTYDTVFKQDIVIRMVLNGLLRRLIVKKLTDCADYLQMLSYEEEQELMQEAFPLKRYIV